MGFLIFVGITIQMWIDKSVIHLIIVYTQLLMVVALDLWWYHKRSANMSLTLYHDFASLLDQPACVPRSTIGPPSHIGLVWSILQGQLLEELFSFLDLLNKCCAVCAYNAGIHK